MMIWYSYNMSDRKRIVPRSKMSARERRTRSRLAQLISQRGILRGSLLLRRRVCGKPNCKCTRGQKHESLYLVISEGGRTRQLYVPRDWESRVRRWVEDYHRARQLMEEISRIYWDKVRTRQD
jgi:hypothetical protein